MLLLTILFTNSAFVDTAVVPVYSALVCLVIASFLVNEQSAPAGPKRQLVYAPIRKKAAEIVKDTRPWQDRFGGCWETSPSRAEGLEDYMVYQGVPYIKRKLSVKLDVKVVWQMSTTGDERNMYTHYRHVDAPVPKKWKFGPIKVGTCREDAEMCLTHMPEDNVLFECRVWYDEEADTLNEECTIKEGKNPKIDGHTLRVATCLPDGRLKHVMKIWRDNDPVGKSVTYVCDKASENFGGSIAY